MGPRILALCTQPYNATMGSLCRAINCNDGKCLAPVVAPDFRLQIWRLLRTSRSLGSYLDFGLNDGEGTALCERLKERGVPFVLHSGYDQLSDVCRSGIVLPKPATRDELVTTVRRILLHARGHYTPTLGAVLASGNAPFARAMVDSG